ncbi:uncharacterized protein [Procambarus clarkii]|uniref:uncharacterized protein n=1 Tax=Procambarus clarkii TaxID=6728 RepID=UPI003743805A
MLGSVPQPVFPWVYWCRHTLPTLIASHRYRALVLSSMLVVTIVLLSVPYVPERLLGIRSPANVFGSFNLPQNSEKPTEPTDIKKHALQKRQIPHKFWARARPHNKFKGRKKHPKLQPSQPRYDRHNDLALRRW